jgi:hypothetical protein
MAVVSMTSEVSTTVAVVMKFEVSMLSKLELWEGVSDEFGDRLDEELGEDEVRVGLIVIVVGVLLLVDVLTGRTEVVELNVTVFDLLLQLLEVLLQGEVEGRLKELFVVVVQGILVVNNVIQRV